MMARGDDCCYLCNECPNSFATLDELEAHMADDHLAAKKAAASSTSATYQGPSFIKQESVDVEDDTDMKMDLDQDMNDCEEPMNGHSPTSSDSSTMSDADDKFGVGHTPPLFVGARIAGHSCRICGRAFSDRGQLNVHYTHTHRDKPQYECEHCQAVFCVKRELSTHLRIHSGEQPHKCEICGKEFGTRQLLKKHNMWHSGERNHECPTCRKAFFQKGHLTQHLMIHKGGRPHRCTQCEKTFIFKFDLNRHMKIHVERGHSCGKCGKSFLKPASLEEHANKCKGTIGSPPIDSTRTSTPMSDISRHETPTPMPLSRRLSNTSLNVSASPQIHSPFQLLSNMIKHETSPAEATVAPVQTNNMFNPQFLMSQFNSEDQVNAAQNLMAHYNEQNQQRLLMMTAAQRILGLGQSPQPAQTNVIHGLFCNLCNKHYPNAAAFTIHYSLMHLKTLNSQHENDNELKLSVHKTEEMLNVHSDSATISSCASSPQKISPVSNSDSDHHHKYCDQCDCYRQKVTDLEKELEKANDECTRLRGTMQRFNTLAGTLLGAQNQGTFEMDKLGDFPFK